MNKMLMYDKYEDNYKTVVDIEELKKEDAIKEIIKEYVEENDIKEMKIHIEDLYQGKKSVEVFIQ